VWKSWKAGNYESEPTDKELENMINGRRVRLGAYGDPAMLPIDVLKRLQRLSNGCLGYTSQWSQSWFDPEVLNYCCASLYNTAAVQKLKDMFPKAKYFRILQDPDEKLLNGEIICLNERSGKMCHECGLCNGRRSNVVILAHGSWAKRMKDYANGVQEV
jgi:hypothetical protein